MRPFLTALATSLLFPLAAHAQAAAEGSPATSETGEQPAAAAAPPPAAPAAPLAAPAPIPAVAAPAAPPPIAFGWDALVDAYYLYNFTGVPKTQGPILRQFDTLANSLTLNYAKLGVHAETELVSFRVDLGAGYTAAVINATSADASEPSSANVPGGTVLYGSGFLVQQAFATVKPLPYLAIDAGRFVTSAGAEVIETHKNWLYSRSLLFYGVPLLHTGLRVNLLPDPALTVSLQVVNGWNNDPDINSHKTFGANVTYAPPNAGLTASLTSYLGKEGFTADGGNTRLLIDAVFLKDLGNLSLGANVDYFKLASANWFGVAGMARYLVNQSFTAAARAEYLRSKNRAYPPVNGSVYELTAMGAWTVDKHYELRLEIRADMSDQEIFAKDLTPRKNQVTGLLGALAYF